MNKELLPVDDNRRFHFALSPLSDDAAADDADGETEAADVDGEEADDRLLPGDRWQFASAHPGQLTVDLTVGNAFAVADSKAVVGRSWGRRVEVLVWRPGPGEAVEGRKRCSFVVLF